MNIFSVLYWIQGTHHSSGWWNSSTNKSIVYHWTLRCWHAGKNIIQGIVLSLLLRCAHIGTRLLFLYIRLITKKKERLQRICLIRNDPIDGQTKIGTLFPYLDWNGFFIFLPIMWIQDNQSFFSRNWNRHNTTFIPNKIPIRILVFTFITDRITYHVCIK